MWRNRFGIDFGPVVRQNTELMKGKGYPISHDWYREEYNTHP
jgi:hypothetical protein